LAALRKVQEGKWKSNRVLSREIAEEMLTPFISKKYGLGLSIDKNGYFSHRGSNEGFECVMIAHRDKGYGVVVTSNGDRGSSLCSEILRSVAKEYEWEEILPKEHEVFRTEREDLEAYTGRFSPYADDVITLKLEGEQLFILEHVSAVSMIVI
jgi:hypothetical protein